MTRNIRWRLSLMMFLEFFIWGAWLPLIFGYLPSLGFSPTQQSLILNTFPIAAIVGMFFSNEFADRNFAAEKVLAFSHLVGGLAIGALAWTRSFWLFFLLMLVYCLLYVPTISITNSIAFANLKDAQKDFGLVRLWGTIGWIAAAWPFTFILVDWDKVHEANAQGFVNWLGAVLSSGLTGDPLKKAIAWTYIVAGLASLALAAFSLILPHTPPNNAEHKEDKLAWVEAGRLLKPGGLMAFTFHHSADAPWVDVLEALFNAGYLLVATYPIRSDETKGATGAFGSRKIEYDIVHVCRKRLEEPKAVSWARMRRWVKDEAAQLKELLEHSHGKELPESDLTIILIGKGLEFYSRHYGQVYTGEGQQLGVGNALLGVKLLLEDLSADTSENGKRRPPDAAEPASRLFLRIFQGRRSMWRDDLGKTLRGTGISIGDLEARGWIQMAGTQANVIPIEKLFRFFTAPGRNRKVLKTDLDQAHFLIGAAMPGSGMDVSDELNRATLQIKKSVDPILDWYAQTDPDTGIQQAAKLALDLVSHWRAKPKKGPEMKQMTLFEQLEAEA